MDFNRLRGQPVQRDNNVSKLRAPAGPPGVRFNPPDTSSSGIARDDDRGSSTFPMANSSQRALSSRKKVVLEPGCSPLDWARLTSSGENLRGIQPQDFPMKVDKKTLSLHNHRQDCWTVLKGRVYNITSYLRFHPGGIEEIMKCAGKDGTLLFMKYHAWVNYERMLENCLVGVYIG